MPVALAEAPVPRIHVTERLLSLHRAQPAPPLHTRRLLPAERRDTAWALVAGGQQGRCRDVGWGWWDGLIGYDIPTVGRLCAAPTSAAVAARQVEPAGRGFECTSACTMRGAHYEVWGGKGNNEAHCCIVGLIVPTMSPSALIVEQ